MLRRNPQKRELQERLWPATFVSESNLATLIKEIRSALRDDARKPQYIRTVHGFGYAFCIDLATKAGRSRTPVAWLLCDGFELPLFDGRNVIGRDHDAGVRIDQSTISRHHAVIAISGGTATLEDLNSKNGTWIDSEAIHGSVPIDDGAEILLGSVRARFHSDSTRSSTVTVKKAHDRKIGDRR